ncbi:MAG TPA: SdrD B-like domain-containing protein, partial [Candidatus Lustribacter sp.]|nr:SdrD B-like domain-containing protein [Candidatus Lustribacter sp.]
MSAPAPSSAAQLDAAITTVSIREESSGLFDRLHVDLAWQVPDGSHAGDTFRLTLPSSLRMRATVSFDLTDPTDAVVAHAHASGSTAVFTLTEYAEAHVGVEGTAWFEVNWNSQVLDPGTKQTVAITVAGSTFTDTVDIDPRPTNAEPLKKMSWVDDDEVRLGWSIVAGLVTPDQVGSTLVLTETAGDGQAVDCSTVHVIFGSYRDKGTITNGATYPRATWTSSSCSVAAASVRLTVPASAVGKTMLLTGRSDVTDPKQTKFRNTGKVVIDGKGTPVSTTTVRASGGGTGYGNKSVSVGDLVWLDANHNGIQDGAERGIAGVTLRLVGPSGAGVTSLRDTPVGAVVTDSAGHYSFTDLPALGAGQSYTVTVTPPTGPVATLTGAGTAATDSSAGSASSGDLTVNDASDLTLDFGYWEPIPAIRVLEGDVRGNAADTQAHAVTLPNGSTGLELTVTNTGNEALTDLAVSDLVLAGGTVAGLTCDFSAVGGPAVGTTWSGPLAAGASFPCTAALSGVDPGAVHEDIATVTGTGAVSGTTVKDDNAYHGTRPKPGVTVVKGDTHGNTADTALSAASVPSGSAGLVLTVKNVGSEVLESIIVTDLVVSNGIVTGLACDLSTLGGPATGTTWAGPLHPGESFGC